LKVFIYITNSLRRNTSQYNNNQVLSHKDRPYFMLATIKSQNEHKILHEEAIGNPKSTENYLKPELQIY